MYEVTIPYRVYMPWLTAMNQRDKTGMSNSNFKV